MSCAESEWDGARRSSCGLSLCEWCGEWCGRRRYGTNTVRMRTRRWVLRVLRSVAARGRVPLTGGEATPVEEGAGERVADVGAVGLIEKVCMRVLKPSLVDGSDSGFCGALKVGPTIVLA